MATIPIKTYRLALVLNRFDRDSSLMLRVPRLWI
jgi:hypothetical protein